jgi:GntR family transcriptional regulator
MTHITYNYLKGVALKRRDAILRYVSVYNKLEAAIRSGDYPTGTLLPAENELMALYQVSRTTIRRAVALLQEAGYVNVRQGRGTEVLRQMTLSEPYTFQKDRQVVGVTSRFLMEGEITTQGATVEIIPAESQIAKALSIETGADVYRIQRVKFIQKTVFAYVISYVPRHLFEGLEAHSGNIFSLYQCLKDHYGYCLTHAEEIVTAGLSKFLEARLLDIPIGSPVLVLKRTAYREKELFEYSISYFRPDIYQMVVFLQGNYDY